MTATDTAALYSVYPKVTLRVYAADVRSSSSSTVGRREYWREVGPAPHRIPHPSGRSAQLGRSD